MAAPDTDKRSRLGAEGRRVKEVIISGKNQITLPPAATRATGWQRGDHLLVGVVGSDMVVLMRKPADWVEQFAGALSEVFGTGEETRDYLERERQTWERLPA
jgi:hypothetical protein